METSIASRTGLRFKALRVHRECHRFYASIEANAAKLFNVGIRSEHYLPWLFTPLLNVPGKEGRSLAVASVLFSDAMHARELGSHTKNLELRRMGDLITPVLHKEALWRLAEIDTVNGQAWLALQDNAVRAERIYVDKGEWITPEEERGLA